MEKFEFRLGTQCIFEIFGINLQDVNYLPSFNTCGASIIASMGLVKLDDKNPPTISDFKTIFVRCIKQRH
jgi:hypothetical protein